MTKLDTRIIAFLLGGACVAALFAAYFMGEESLLSLYGVVLDLAPDL